MEQVHVELEAVKCQERLLIAAVTHGKLTKHDLGTLWTKK